MSIGLYIIVRNIFLFGMVLVILTNFVRAVTDSGERIPWRLCSGGLNICLAICTVLAGIFAVLCVNGMPTESFTLWVSIDVIALVALSVMLTVRNNQLDRGFSMIVTMNWLAVIAGTVVLIIILIDKFFSIIKW